MIEEWKDIEGFEGLYQVSNLGRVKSLERKVNADFNLGKTHIYKEKILKPYKEARGYLKVTLYNNGKKKKFKVHKLVLEAFVGKSELTINHKDENKMNNNLNNLEYMTNKNNVRYSQAKKVVGININTGEKIFFNAMGDVKEKGFNQSHVSDCCLKKRNKHKNYIWRFI